MRIRLPAPLPIVLLVLATACRTGDPSDGRIPTLNGSWRVVGGARAPWLLPDDAVPDTTEWKLETLVFDTDSVVGPGVLECRDPSYDNTRMPADALFQGNLPEPPERVARALGFRNETITGVSLTCDTGVFEFHFVQKDTAIVAVDNVLWTMVRTGR